MTTKHAGYEIWIELHDFDPKLWLRNELLGMECGLNSMIPALNDGYQICLVNSYP